MIKRLRKMFLGFILIVAVLAAASCGYTRLPKFGAFPEGARLQRIEASPNYRDGEFRNLEPIPEPAVKRGPLQRLVSFYTTLSSRADPPVGIPTVKTDLMALDKNEDIVIWLGHSSFYMQLAGHRILVDPVFSENAAPIPFAIQAFSGTNIYTAKDMPEIGLLLITHDHWDHLDYPTVISLKDKTTKIVCPLGVGAHFERWGFSESSIIEMDWHESFEFSNNFTIHTLPARHYSGRTFVRNKALWAAYVLTSSNRKLYLSGDSGYGAHYRDAGESFGGFDLVILDSGQYNERWRYTHMMPEDTAQAASELNAKALLPAHAGKFSIAYHTWDDPFIRLVQATQNSPFRLLTPKIGEPVRLDTDQQDFQHWWKDVPEQ